jgi:putative membrane protein
MEPPEARPPRPLPPLPENETLRLHQANERTLLAWLRTGIAMMGFGFVVARFGLVLRELAAVQHSPRAPSGASTSVWIGVALAGMGVALIVASLVRFARVRAAIERGDVGAPDVVFVYVAGGITAAIGMAIVAVLLASA